MHSETSEERVPVVALHCSLGSSAQWRSLARAMPEREVIALDLLGYGNTPAPARDDRFSLDDEVDAIERTLLERPGCERALHLVGHSYGGAVAWRFALRNPGRVRSIALFEPVTIWLVQHHPAAESFLHLAKSVCRAVEVGLSLQAARRFIDFWSGPDTFSSLPNERQSAIVERMGKVRLDFIACLSECSALPAPGYLQMPALLMNGSDGLDLMRTNIRILRRAFGDSATAEIQGGHMAPVENRAHVDSAIASFIRRSEHQTASTELLGA